eukprot:g8835.t1
MEPLPASLELRATRHAGRGLFARRGFAEGERTLQAAPVMEDWPYQCSSCGSTWCSDACRRSDGPKHEFECALLQGLEEQKKVSAEVRDNVALLISLHAFAASATTLEVMGEDQLTKRDRASPMLGACLHGKPPSFLPFHQEPLRRPGAKRRQRLRRDALQLYARLGGAATLPAATLRPAELDAALAAMPLNAFGLWERGEEDGHCLVPLASMMNHSCVPNCRYQVENGAISFYALRDIEVDEELTFSYIDDSSMSTAERKRFIRTSWDFECRCLRCTADGADAAPKGARMTTRTLWAVGTVRTVVDAAVEVNACQVSHIAAVLNSCAQMQWRDDHLLCGLTEALRCAAELRRGTVRDYAVCLQSLRRLNYCPWVGALRPLIHCS